MTNVNSIIKNGDHTAKCMAKAWFIALHTLTGHTMIAA